MTDPRPRDRTPITMIGAAGRMGRMILGLAAAEPKRYAIVGALDHAEHSLQGQPLSNWIANGPADIALAAQPPDNPPADTVAIHFCLPDGSVEHLDWSRRGARPTVIGTTGFSDDQLAAIRDAAADAPIMLTPNTSTGVNVLFWLAARAAELLDEDYDLEVTEIHHRHKKDAPSGTARRLAEVALAARGRDYATDVDHGREGLTGERLRGRLGMHTLRGGDVVGEHTLVLAGPGERLELTHRAHTRETFARGALRAAAWLRGQSPGLYSMNDMLGL